MGNLSNNHLLIFAGILAIILEVVLGAATGFDLLILGVIAAISGGIGIYLDSFSTALICVGVLSLLYVFVGRKVIKNKLDIKSLPMNVDNLVHKKALVIKAIMPDKPGQVKIEGEIWRASADIHIGSGVEVEIVSISGVTVHVVKI